MKRIIYYSILIFIFSCFTGFFYARLWKNNNENFATENITEASNTVAETLAIEEKVSFNSSFAIKKYYDECGHYEINYSELPNELINLTKTEVENLFPEWEVEEFSSNGVMLAKRETNICNEHYVLKMNDDEVDVFHIEKDRRRENVYIYKYNKRLFNTRRYKQFKKWNIRIWQGKYKFSD